jgi:chemotaxis protein methyltransferase CheR
VSRDRALLISALSNACGLELASFRPEHVDSRIRRALQVEGADDVAHLLRLTRSDRAVRARFRRLIAVSVSGFFRDAAQFDLLEHELLAPLLASRRRMTVWSAGCSDGSELYSVAIVLERLGALERSFLLGSDLLAENIAVARRGRYDDLAISAQLRARVRWEQRDLVRDGALGVHFRVVLCRNVAIYLAPAEKRALHKLLVGSLATGGVLLLGTSERLADHAALGLERAAPHAYRRVV